MPTVSNPVKAVKTIDDLIQITRQTKGKDF